MARVLVWSDMLAPYLGGIETLSSQLLPCLRARGHELVVISSHYYLELPDETELAGIRVLRFRFRETLRNRDLAGMMHLQRKLRAVVESLAPDLLHLNGVAASTFFLRQLRRARPLLVTTHSALASAVPEEQSLLAETLRDADWVNAVSEAQLASVVARVPEIRSRASVIHNGLALPPGDAVPLPARPSLLCLSRLVPEKGIDLAIEAVRRSPGLEIVIAGAGPERAALEARAQGLAVRFLGGVALAEVPRLIEAATAVVVPSRYEEPFGLVALEAGHHRRPVVAARAGGLQEIVVHGETGLMFARDDVAELAACLTRVCSDCALAERLGAGGHRRAAEHFGLDRCADAYDALYRRLAPGRH